MRNKYSKNTFYIALLLTTLLAGCTGQQLRTHSSVMDYLYPNTSGTVVKPSTPLLKLPLNIGIAFVPGQSSTSDGRNPWTNQKIIATKLTEAQKINLLKKISGNFKKYEFINTIELIPSSYLSSGGSFAELDKLREMYEIDVIALISFDQVQFTDEGALSLTYWTIVGAYIFTGEKNDTSTLMDTVVFDISSRKMLFRAPGTSNIKGASTLVDLSKKLREDSYKGFDLATTNMIDNLKLQLEMFRKKAKENPDKIRITR